MIEVTRLNGSILYLNPDLILSLESTPDAVVTMTNGEKFVVKEGAQEILARFLAYKRSIQAPAVR